MVAARGDVSLVEASKLQCDVDTGLVIPIPPRRTDRANRSLSSLEQGGRPVRAGIKCYWIASSSGFNRSAISGMVRDRKDQRLERP